MNQHRAGSNTTRPASNPSNVYPKVACEGYASGVTAAAWCLVWANERCH